MERSSSPSAAGLLVAAPMAYEARLISAAAPGLDVRRTGVGRRRACASAEEIASGSPVRLLVVMGFAGGLEPDACAGAVVIADELRGREGERVACGAAGMLAAALEGEGVAVRRGAVASVTRPALGRGRTRLHDELGAIAADMESLWLAQAVSADALAVVRVVSDAPRAGVWRPLRGAEGLLAARASLRRAAAAVGRLANAQLSSGVGML